MGYELVKQCCLIFWKAKAANCYKYNYVLICLVNQQTEHKLALDDFDVLKYCSLVSRLLRKWFDRLKANRCTYNDMPL